MKEIETLLTPFIREQFPSFYKEEGPNFIEFVRAYYEWMQQTDKVNYYIRNLPEFKDIDLTPDSFLVHFKEKYAKNIQFNIETDRRTLLKHALELYRSKGTERAFTLFFRLVYGDDPEIYYPSEDIMSLSSGKWNKPVYLELSYSPRTKDFVRRQIRGLTSGSTAFVQSYYKKRASGKYIDIISLTNLSGDFETNEIITDDGTVVDCPKIIGSLSDLIILDGGANYSVGDILNISGGGGILGRARVAATANSIGAVDFSIADQGWGYSTQNNTSRVYVAEKILYLANIDLSHVQTVGDFYPNTTGEYLFLDTITQPKIKINANNFAGNVNSTDIVNGLSITQYYANGAKQANGYLLEITPAAANVITYTVVPNIGTFTAGAGNTVWLGNSSTANAISATANSITNTTPYGEVIDVTYTYEPSTNNYSAVMMLVGVSNSTVTTAFSNTVGNVVRALYSNVYGTCTEVELQEIVLDASFDVGELENQEDVRVNSDIIAEPPTTVKQLVVANSAGAFTVGEIARQSSSIYGNVAEYRSLGGNNALIFLNNTNGVFLNNQTLTGDSSGRTANVTTIISAPSEYDSIALNANGYMLPKQPGANLNSIILTGLTFLNQTIGSANTIVNLDRGEGYTVPPKTKVVDIPVSSLDLKDYVVFISNATGVFYNNEIVSNTISANTFRLNGVSGSFENNDQVYQLNGSLVEIANGFVVKTVGSSLFLKDIQGTFNNTFSLLSRSGSNTGTFSNTSYSNLTSIAKGSVRTDTANTSFVRLRRYSINESFKAGMTITGQDSGFDAYVDRVEEDNSVQVAGNNAVILSDTKKASGVITDVQIINSGYGYVGNSSVEVLPVEGTGTGGVARAEVKKQGVSEGSYASNKGFLSGDKYLPDGHYYQDFSYEIRSAIPVYKYDTIVRDTLHVAGTRFFGKIRKVRDVSTPISSIDSSRRIRTQLGNISSSNSVLEAANTFFQKYANGLVYNVQTLTDIEKVGSTYYATFAYSSNNKINTSANSVIYYGSNTSATNTANVVVLQIISEEKVT